MSSFDRDIRRFAKHHGFKLHRRTARGGHFIWRRPGCSMVVTSGSPSDCRAVRNAERDFRRAVSERR